MGERLFEARLIEQPQIEELSKNWQLLERMFVSLNEAIFILDASTEVRDCNPAASRVFGYSREEMLGKATNFLHGNETFLQEFRTRVFKALEERDSLFPPQFQMRRKNGDIFFTDHSLMPLKDEHRRRMGRDNGGGITPEEIGRSHSLGLVGMGERALITGGALEIKGEREEGQRLFCGYPTTPGVDHRIR